MTLENKEETPTQDIPSPPTDGTERTSRPISPSKNNNQENEKKPEEKQETTTQETVTDPVDSSVKIETQKSKLEGTTLSGISNSTPTCEEKLDVSELDKGAEDANEKQEINPLDKSSSSEQSADVDNISESAIKTKTDMNGDTSDSSAENPKTKSDTESDEGSEDEKKHVENGSRFSMKARDDDLTIKRPSDIHTEMDYGIVDPLEVARQVAIEVEREVDSQERSCSTSRNVSGGGTDSINEKECEPIEPVNDVSLAHEPGPNAERGFSGFDLNEEVSSEETDGPVLTQVSIVSASRPAAAGGPPAAPLQFEGTLGWKGSAATSAFRRVPEVDKTSDSNQHRLDFDLNVAEDIEDKPEPFDFDLNDGGPQSPSFRNIDLNNTFLGNAYKQEESTISLFGTQVEIKRKDSLVFDPPTDFSLGRPGPGLGLGSLTNYANVPAAYGHNGFMLGPIYEPPGAPIPYMGSPAPFMFNMGATGSNGAGPSRHGFDLNSEGGNNGVLRQFSILGGKRQEPDSGWEVGPVNYKHQQPPWQ